MCQFLSSLLIRGIRWRVIHLCVISGNLKHSQGNMLLPWDLEALPQSQLKARPLLQLHIKLHHKAPLLQGVPYHVLCTTSCKKSYINHRHLSCISKYTEKNTAQHAGGRPPPTLYSPFRFTEVYFNAGLPSMEYCTHLTAS